MFACFIAEVQNYIGMDVKPSALLIANNMISN